MEPVLRMASGVALVGLLAGSTIGQTVVVEAPRIHTGAAEGARTPPVLEPGALLVRDGRVVSVGRTVGIPPDAQLYRFEDDVVVTPGFIDAGSALEFAGDRGALSLDLDPLRAVFAAPDSVRALAVEGVTTVLLRSAATDGNGSRMVAVKTVGGHRSERTLSPLAAIRLPFPGSADPLLHPDRLRARLKAGKEYHEQWQKYFQALAEWEKAQEEGKQAAAAAPVDEEPEVAPPPAADDPISGTWELTSEGRRGPSVSRLRLQHADGRVQGVLEGGFGGRPGGGEQRPRPVQGTFQGGKLELDAAGGEQFNMRISAEVSGESMTGVMRINDRFERPFTGKRIEKAGSSAPIVIRRRKRADDGRPTPPTRRDELEPYRSLFDGRIPLVVEAGSKMAARAAAALAAEYEVELVLYGEPEATGAIDAQCRGFLFPSADDLATPAAFKRWAAGVPTLPFALQSTPSADRGGLYARTLGASLRGASPDDLLRALTAAPAELFQLERVGTLEPGKDADFLIFDGEVFEPRTRLLHTFIGGARVERSPGS